MSVIDTDPNSATYNTVVSTITVGPNPEGVAVSPDGTRAYVTNRQGGNSVSVIDTASNRVTETILGFKLPASWLSPRMAPAPMSPITPAASPRCR